MESELWMIKNDNYIIINPIKFLNLTAVVENWRKKNFQKM